MEPSSSTSCGPHNKDIKNSRDELSRVLSQDVERKQFCDPTLKDDVFCGDQFTFCSLAALSCYSGLIIFGGVFIKLFDLYACIYFASFPGLAIMTYAIMKYRREVFVKQAIYCALLMLLLCIPLTLVLPMVRSGWGLFVRLVGTAFIQRPAAWAVTLGFVFWCFVDAFCLQSFLQEAVKYVLIRRMLHMPQVVNHRSLIVYGLSGAMVLASIDGISEAASVRSFIGALGSIVHYKGVIWSYGAYQACFAFPMHAASVFLMSSLLARRKFSEDTVSCFQVLFYPILLHGLPNFISRLLRAVARSYTWRVVGGKVDPSHVDHALMVKLAASQALLQFVSFSVMTACLVAAVCLARHWYTKLEDSPPIDVHHMRSNKTMEGPSFPLSFRDLGVEWSQEASAEQESLLDENQPDV
eukprot:GHVQ01015580.1.p1 GENE.GHVQ01015580.1~~GHVQ01015580.1.p1  ORF type:complete len:411 (+),score=20.56 GHVQ01015580.1:170-1402(+)